MSFIFKFLQNVKILGLTLLTEKIHWNSEVNQFNLIDDQAKLYGPYFIKMVTVGKGTYIAKNSCITNARIGKFCSIGPNFFCGWGIHPINGFSTSPVFYSTRRQPGFSYSKIDKIKERAKIEIGNDVFIGANVTVLDGVTIGHGAVIGAGAVVSKDIPPYAVAVGCPVQIIKYRFSAEVIKSLLEIQWWDCSDAVLKNAEKHFFNIADFIKYIKLSDES